MAKPRPQLFDDLFVDHIALCVSDLATTTRWLVDGYGFTVYATADPPGQAGGARSVGVGRSDIRLVVTEPLAAEHPAAGYVERHGDGVADIALRTRDAAAAFEEAVRRGAEPVAPPARHGTVVTATIGGFGDVLHTFVQRDDGADEVSLPGLRPMAAIGSDFDAGLYAVDHFAVCLEPGGLAPTVEFYETVLDFDMVFTEHIVVGAQAMNSNVVESGNGAVTLTLLEPDQTCDPGQIDTFLANHGGPGVQHVAFNAADIVYAVEMIRSRGVEFLSTPASYYSLLRDRLQPARHSVRDLQQQSILVDEDHDGQLFQVFARSMHPRNTLFLEVIERAGATTFGSGNARALYEAVEHQRDFELTHSEDGAA